MSAYDGYPGSYNGQVMVPQQWAPQHPVPVQDGPAYPVQQQWGPPVVYQPVVYEPVYVSQRDMRAYQEVQRLRYEAWVRAQERAQRAEFWGGRWARLRQKHWLVVMLVAPLLALWQGLCALGRNFLAALPHIGKALLVFFAVMTVVGLVVLLANMSSRRYYRY